MIPAAEQERRRVHCAMKGEGIVRRSKAARWRTFADFLRIGIAELSRAVTLHDRPEVSIQIDPMPNAETQNLTALVEKQTGYPVAVEIVEEMTDHSKVISARPDAPAHIIKINATHRQHSDYLTAMQCWMLLILWSNPARVPKMVFQSEAHDALLEKCAGADEHSDLTDAGKDLAAKLYVNGLLNQLNSMPIEIRALSLCHELCPSLREMQEEAVNAYLRILSQTLSPKVMQRIPRWIFEGNVGMSAAFVLNWARLSGSNLCLLPYESTGHIERGQKLLGEVDAALDRTSESHTQIVDAWARQLSLDNVYRWEFSDRTQ